MYIDTQVRCLVLNNEEIKKYILKTYEIENVFFSDEEIKVILKGDIKKMKKNIQKQNYFKWEDYFIDGTTVLKNIPGIKTKEELEIHEKQNSASKLVELCKKPINGDFDYNHLMQIHEYLFRDVYPWAGEIRTVGMSKNSTDFCPPENIKNNLTATLSQAKEEVKSLKNKTELSRFLAVLFYQLIYIHPFREGNGRTIREFIRELTESLDFDFGSYVIDYSNINDSTLAMCMVGGYGMTSVFLAPEFMNALMPIEKSKTKKAHI